MKLDRPLQLKILKSLKDNYPNVTKVAPIKAANEHEDFMPNMHYLIGHGLIINIVDSGFDVKGRAPDILQAKITEKGLDFLEDDGGVGAILKTITVKFDPDNIRELITLKVDKLEIPTDKKNSLKSLIKEAPAQTLKSLCTRLINTGLDKAADLYSLIQTSLINPPSS